MKKYILFIFVLLLSGCSNNYKCSLNADNYSSKIKVIFKDKKVYKYKQKDLKEFNIYSKDLDKYYKLKKDDLNDLISNNYAKIKKEKDYVASYIDYDFKNKDLNNIILINKNDNLKESISKIENSGYICK